ncbi:hypothetical protein OAI_18020 [Vibrio cyclitrophicus FF160]|uniref:hypothetical protein n=1 Tax=Vibrio cyclitrophicus TaxID=47951 RepID=UPI0002F893FF|nr:hypothetical protein [Vibrio cyclitrophicus]OEE85235.1 hypothetical protein OAI_18020 [Vibrio cyclitrophicus FF160]PME86477.1 hypothetical protein BCV26_21385 [Vibrio cyclitrophicus]PMJ20052.1 hypothetical protein BCU28_13865 [Vibrio cyclitrophicus]PMJ93763.1 hypothetical protein BCU11_21110 [Vibrio cyclitrophicus]
MQISKVATAVALSTGLLFGCNSDGLPIPTDSGAGSQESVLTTGYWQISDGNSSSISASSNADLPNVYVFQEDGNHKYYDDDDDLGTYTIKDASASTNNYDEEAGTVSFTYYETGTSTIEILDGVFSFDDAGALNISDNTTGIDYSGSDQTATDAVQEAISEANEANGINGYVQILDTNNGGVKNDVGELRLKLSDSSTGATVDSIASGKVTVDLIYQVDEDTEQEANGSGNNAYISLYASGTSNTNLHGEVIFNAGEIFYRSTVTDSSGKPQIPDEPVGTYTLGEDLAVEISWASGYYTFKVNDTVYDNSGNGFEAFDKAAVTIVSLKLGDTSNTTHYELNADNFKVYSNDTASDELVFEDNFNNYPNGQALSGNPYNNNTAEATVVVDGGNTEPDPDPTDNQVAAITDTDTSDTGELRYKFDSGMTTGTHKVSMYYDVAETESAYVSLFDTKNSTSSLIGEFKIDEGKITLRGEDTQVTTFTPGTWIDLEMSWDTSSLSTAGTYTVKVNGAEYGPYTSQNTTPGVEVTATTIKFSSNGGTADTTLYVDDYKVYSDTAGTSEIFSDDYENYSIGANLSASPYNSSTFSAVVAEDPLNAE